MERAKLEMGVLKKSGASFWQYDEEQVAIFLESLGPKFLPAADTFREYPLTGWGRADKWNFAINIDEFRTLLRLEI